MVKPSNQRKNCGMLVWELVAAMAILAGVFFPLSLSLVNEGRVLRAGYFRAVAIDIVDGEMEVLTAGEWRAYPSGVHEYRVSAFAATNLPPGKFLLTVTAQTLRLEWKPTQPLRGGAVWREAQKS